MEYMKTEYQVTEVTFGKAVRLPDSTTVMSANAKRLSCTILYDGWTFRMTFKNGAVVFVPTANVAQFSGEPLTAAKKNVAPKERTVFEPA